MQVVTTRRTLRRRPSSQRRRRWMLFFVSIFVGLSLGLIYGWVINPVQYVDTTPDKLRADFKTDYVLMVAEGYSRHRDLDWARRYLALLGDQPDRVVEEALNQAVMVLGYGSEDLHLMRTLLQDLRRSETP